MADMNNPEQNLSPQDIAQFKEGYQVARQLIYQKQVFDSLVHDLGKGDPVDVIASAVVMVMLRVQESSGQFSLSVAAALGIALIDDVTQAIEEAGILQLDADIQQRVFQAAVTLWLQSNNYPPQQVAQELQAIGAPPEIVQGILASGSDQAEQTPQQGLTQAPMARADGMGKQPRGLLQRGM